MVLYRWRKPRAFIHPEAHEFLGALYSHGRALCYANMTRLAHIDTGVCFLRELGALVASYQLSGVDGADSSFKAETLLQVFQARNEWRL